MTALRKALLHIVLPAVVVASATLGPGCVHVPPYKREDLSRPGMDLEREANAQQFHSHVQDSREGATGGHGSTGGGCGCN